MTVPGLGGEKRLQRKRRRGDERAELEDVRKKERSRARNDRGEREGVRQDARDYRRVECARTGGSSERR